MIEAKETLIGNISSKKTLTGKINNAIEKVYPELEDITITPSNKEQHFKSNKYGYGSITVESVSEEYIIPTGDLEINSNGTYDVKEKANAIVNVPEKQLGTKVIDKNGVYNATDDNLDGYSSVDIQTSGVDINEYFETTITKSNSRAFYSNAIKKYPTFTIDSSTTEMIQTFSNYSKEVISIIGDTSNVTNFQQAFYYAKIKEFPTIDTSKAWGFYETFYGCSNMINFPQINTSNGSNFGNLCRTCSKLETIGELDFSKATSINGAFNYCYKLTTLGGFINLGKNYDTTRGANYADYTLNLSSATKLTHDSLMNVINNLYDIASVGVQPQQLILGSTNLAKLNATEEGQQAILNAQNKGWSVS